MYINKDLYQKSNSDLTPGQDVLREWESYRYFSFTMTDDSSSNLDKAVVVTTYKVKSPSELRKIFKSHKIDYNLANCKDVFKNTNEIVILKIVGSEDVKKDWAGRNKKTGFWYGNGNNGSLLIKKPTIKITWDKVCLEEEKKVAIFNALSQVKNADLIFNKWGFGKTIEKGRALTFLFYGVPGTGKTLTAQAIADYLDFDLLTITPTELNDKYFGETEKRIREVFRKADSRTVILFDECDGLIMDRQKGNSITVPHINQFIYDLEHFDGVCVFTTNNINFLDKALERRLALKIEFSNPTQEIRELIWRGLIPKECPLGKDVDFVALAQFPLNGGHIKNIVLNAARSAAKNKEKHIGMKYFIEAIQIENDGIKGFNK